MKLYKPAIFGAALLMCVPTLARPKEAEAYVPAGVAFTQEEIEMFESMIVISTTETEASTDEAEIVVKVEPVIPEPEAIILSELPWSEDIQRWAQEKCRQYNFPYAFFLAMVESESSFICYGDTEDAGGISTGYCMIRECNWKRYEGLNVHDPYDNIEIGVRMLAELKDKYMEADHIIMAYKGGEAAAARWVKEGTRLSICDKVEDRIVHYEEALNGR